MDERAGPALDLGDIALRPWHPDDAPAVLAACQDPDIARWAGVPQPFGPEDATRFIEASLGLGSEGTGVAFAIVDTRSGRLLGAITRFGPDGHRATLGCWVTAEARGRGVGRRAVRGVTDWTFASTDVVRVEAFILAGNDASERMLAHAGFTREGVLRAWEPGPDGTPADCVAWSRLRTDP